MCNTKWECVSNSKLYLFLRKQHKSTSDMTFQVFWSHMIAAFEEQSEIPFTSAVIFHSPFHDTSCLVTFCQKRGCLASISFRLILTLSYHMSSEGLKYSAKVILDCFLLLLTPYRFGMTWGSLNSDRIVIFVVNDS